MSWPGPFQIPFIQSRLEPIATASARPHAEHGPTLICLSHLRWRFVYQRPQHLMTRLARDYPVLYLEEAVASESAEAWLEVRPEAVGLNVLVPHVPGHWDAQATWDAQRLLLDRYLQAQSITRLLLWYYTPMSLAFSDHLRAELVVYDCMDELSAFEGAPPALLNWEQRLLARADLVFTGGHSLFEAKRHRHANIHPFPSSVDTAHFAHARLPQAEPADQAGIARPRLGFYGVIDERLDIELLALLADLRPDWQLVMLGPVVKIDPASLPHRLNLHYLGAKAYEALPQYLAGWDVALMPFALNASTRFISPTKTPEYLAGGCPVVSTPIADVVRMYGDSGLVRIADSAPAFVAAIEAALRDAADRPQLLARADQILGDMSWDNTWARMKEQMQCAIASLRQPH